MTDQSSGSEPYGIRKTVLAKHLMDDCARDGKCDISIGQSDGVNLYPFAALPRLNLEDLKRGP